MTRITNADQILLLLRARLERSSRKDRKSASVAKGREQPLDRVRALKDLGALPPDTLAKALLTGLLAEELGDIVHEAPFQTLISQVHEQLLADEHAKKLLNELLSTVS